MTTRKRVMPTDKEMLKQLSRLEAISKEACAVKVQMDNFGNHKHPPMLVRVTYEAYISDGANNYSKRFDSISEAVDYVVEETLRMRN